MSKVNKSHDTPANVKGMIHGLFLHGQMQQTIGKKQGPE